jgi:hypothetical protein
MIDWPERHVFNTTDGIAHLECVEARDAGAAALDDEQLMSLVECGDIECGARGPRARHRGEPSSPLSLRARRASRRRFN